MKSDLQLSEDMAAAALRDGISLAIDWGMGIFELKKEGMWLDEGIRLMENYRGVEWEWSFYNNWGVIRVYLGKG